MKPTLLFLLLLIAALLPSCEKKRLLIVRWEGGSRMELTKWTVDKEPYGNGVDGFLRFLKRLEAQPDDSYLKVYYPHALWNENTPGYFFPDPFPFVKNDELRKQFDTILANKHITVEEFPAP